MSTSTLHDLGDNELSDFGTAIEACQTPDELFQVVSRQMQHFGFEYVVYGHLTNGIKLESDDNCLVYNGFPDEWTSYYFDHDYADIDPIVRRMSNSALPFDWHETWQLENLSRPQKKLKGDRKDAGLFHGLSVPLHGPHGNVYAFDLARSVDEAIDPAAPMKATMIALQCHTKMMALMPSPANEDHVPKLSRRERQVLMQVRQGKNNNDIAETLGITRHGVKFHLANILRKMGTTDRISAVVKAVRLGLIRH